IVWVVFELSRFHKYGGQFKVGRLNAVIIASSLFLIITTGLAAQRYGYNLVQYHALVPACEQVKNEQACALNGSWERAHQEKQRPQPTSHNPVRYLVSWVARMQITSFYVRSGGADKRAYYKNVGPYIILRITSAVLAFAGAVLFLVYLPSIIRGRPYLVVSLGISIFYCLVLFAHLYASYLATGAKDGINGRYLFPVMLPFMVAAGLGFQRFMSHWERLIPAVFFVVLVLFLQGGGILTFISASNKYWYWPDNRLSNHLNSNAQKIVNPLIIK
ncbi:MAG TPA: hypothetical protein VG964_01395, partial [Candidatus Saccharimonadales bacterium]|nr:hypothetical protein [Candidatus Saccharimonadales bacterium]